MTSQFLTEIFTLLTALQSHFCIDLLRVFLLPFNISQIFVSIFIDDIFFIKVTFSLSDFLCDTPKSALLIYVVDGVTLNWYIFK